jgi:hypothetical protein
MCNGQPGQSVTMKWIVIILKLSLDICNWILMMIMIAIMM